MSETLIAFVQTVASVDTLPYELPPAWRTITKAAHFIGFTLVLGSTVAYSLVLRGALRSAKASLEDRRILVHRSAIVLASAGLVFLLSLWPQLAGKVARAGDGMPFDQALRPENVWSYLTKPGEIGLPLGTMVLIQFSLFALCSLLLVTLFVPAFRRHIDLIAAIAAVGTAIASVTLGLSGDLLGQGVDAWMGKLPSYLHVLSGATWIGGVVALALLGTVRSRLSQDAGLLWAHMWKRFSRVAQGCVAGIILSGLWLLWGVASNPVELFTTTFGRLVLLKLLLVATLIGMGVFNEHVLLPRIAKLRAAGDMGGLFHVAVKHFPVVAAAEAIIGAGVLVIVSFFNGSAREEAGSAEAHATSTMFFATVALIVVLAFSFAINARIQREAEARAHAAGAGAAAVAERNDRAHTGDEDALREISR